MPSNMDELDEKILNYLKSNKLKFINKKDICDHISVSYPTGLKRIGILEAKNLIIVERKGGNKICRLKDE